MRSATTSIRSQMRRLADYRVISWPLFWLSYAWFLIDAIPDYLRADARPQVGVGTVVVATTVAQLVVFTYLAIAKYSYLRPDAARRHPSWTVLSFAVASVLGAIAGRVTELALQPALADAPEPDLFNHAVYQTVALCVIGVVVVALREHQADVASLQSAREGLVATRNAGEQALVVERAQVDERLAQLVDQLTSTLPRIGPADASVVLGYAAADVIRPLSHDLALNAPEPSSRSTVDVAYPSWLATLRSIASGPPLIKPALMAVTIMLLAARLTVTGPTPQSLPPGGQGVQVSMDVTGLFKAVAQLLIVFIGVWFTARVAAWVLRRFALTQGTVAWPATIIATLGIAAGSQALMAAAFVVAGFELPIAAPAGVALFAVPLFVVVFAVAVVRTTAVRRAAAVAELTRVNEDLDWELHRTNEMLWRQRRALSTWLHGPIQATLNAGAIQLAQDGAKKADVDDALRLFTNACARPPGDSPNVDLAGELAAVQTTWAPICDVTWMMDARTADLVAQDAVCSATVADVIVEGCSNSVIHGGATAIDIELQMVGPRALRLTLADDGTFAADPTEGLGTQMLNDVCLSWSRTSGADGTLIDARFPVGPGSAGAAGSPAATVPVRDRADQSAASAD